MVMSLDKVEWEGYMVVLYDTIRLVVKERHLGGLDWMGSLPRPRTKHQGEKSSLFPVSSCSFMIEVD